MFKIISNRFAKSIDNVNKLLMSIINLLVSYIAGVSMLLTVLTSFMSF